MADPPALGALAEGTLAMARPGEALEVHLTRGRTITATVHDRSTTTCSVDEAATVAIRLASNTRIVFAASGSQDLAEIARVVAAARTDLATAAPAATSLPVPAATSSPAAAATSLPGTDVGGTPGHLGGHASPRADDDSVCRGAVRIAEAAWATDPGVMGLFAASWSIDVGEDLVASTTGIFAPRRFLRGAAEAHVIAEDRHRNAGSGVAMEAFADPWVADVARVGRAAGLQAAEGLGARQPRTTRTTVVLDAPVVAQLLGRLWPILATVPRASALVTLLDEPTRSDAPYRAATDDEGLPTRLTRLFDRGRPAAGVAWGALRPMAGPPRPAPRALHLLPADGLPGEAIANVDDGILVRQVRGLNSGVDTTTGAISVGAQGLRIRQGGLAEPLDRFALVGDFVTWLAAVREVCADLTWRGTTAGTTVVIDDVLVSGA